jgi:DnaJ-class molecular chaperone
MSTDDYYSILGLVKPSDQNEIRKAYHKMALKFHPDKNRSPEAADIFKKINEAYDILSTPEKKDIYDQFGKEGLNRNNIHFEESDIFNIFANVFGGQNPFGGQQGFSFGGQHGFSFGGQNPFGGRGFPTSQNHVELVEEITLADVYTGKTVSRSIERNSVCHHCHGTGSDDGKVRVCKMCHGRKIVQQQHMMGPMITIQQIPCPCCQGQQGQQGPNAGHECPDCRGNRIYKEQYNLKFVVPVGQTETDVIVVHGEGHNSPENRSRSDIIIKIKIVPDNNFLRNVIINGRKLSPCDLLTIIKINLAESLCGCDKKIQHINGHEIKLQISNVIKDGDIYIIDGAGLPTKHNSDKGLLYVVFKVTVDTSLSVDQKKILWEMLTKTPYFDTVLIIDPKISKLAD